MNQKRMIASTRYSFSLFNLWMKTFLNFNQIYCYFFTFWLMKFLPDRKNKMYGIYTNISLHTTTSFVYILASSNSKCICVKIRNLFYFTLLEKFIAFVFNWKLFRNATCERRIITISSSKRITSALYYSNDKKY